LKQIDNLHNKNPKEYWKLVNDLTEEKKIDNNQCDIGPSTWYTHFKNLNCIKDKFKEKKNIF
jgi:hypothetical protein